MGWGLTMASLPLQGFVSTVSVSLFRWLAALAGTLAGMKTSPVPIRIAGGLTAWLVFRQLYPFQSREPAAAFSWWPFRAWYEGAPQGYLNLMAGKLFLYLIAIEAWRAAGVALPRAAGFIVVLLGITEAIQCHLAGRTPEITDVVLGAGAALLLAFPLPKPDPGEAQ